jgi:hypothetical protein
VSRASGDTQQQVVRSIIVFPVFEANPKMVLLKWFCLVFVLDSTALLKSGRIILCQNHFSVRTSVLRIGELASRILRHMVR